MNLLLTSLGATSPAPSGQISPLGRFADVVTAIVSMFVIAAAILSHLGIVGTADTFIDTVALVAVGVLYGAARGIALGQQTEATAVTEQAKLAMQLVMAAHDRLDKIHAPTAPLNSSGVRVGTPEPPA